MSDLALAAGAPRRRTFVTPEGVDLGLKLAGLGPRTTAYVVDLAALLGTLIAMTIVAVLGLFATRGAGASFLAILWLLGFFLLRNAYFIHMEAGARGATLGKRFMGLRVVSRDGGRLTLDAVIARNLMREIEWFLPLGFLGYGAATGTVGGAAALAGFAWAGLFLAFPLFNRDRLRIGDLLAGTWVVEVPQRRLGADPAAAQAPTAAFSDSELAAYGAYELQVLAGVLRGGNPDAAQTVANSIREKLGRRANADETDEAFLTAYYEALRAKLERDLLFGRRRANKLDVPAQG